jgi:hypothetical protein
VVFLADVNILITFLVETIRSDGLEKSSEGVSQGKGTDVALQKSQVRKRMNSNRLAEHEAPHYVVFSTALLLRFSEAQMFSSSSYSRKA